MLEVVHKHYFPQVEGEVPRIRMKVPQVDPKVPQEELQHTKKMNKSRTKRIAFLFSNVNKQKKG